MNNVEIVSKLYKCKSFRRCGIAYRNKPDITKHLFWKHGTESVVCKKCLQKKWPHVYHFCIPPNAFVCEECTQSFTKAVALKVHKRLHSDEFPHVCTEENCTQKFISKKLLLKHEFKHREPSGEDLLGGGADEKMNLEGGAGGICIPAIEDATTAGAEESVAREEIVADGENGETAKERQQHQQQPPPPPPKVKIDVYDLPALNLSESDSSDSEDDKDKKDGAMAGDAKALGDGEKLGDVFGEDSQKSGAAAVDHGIWENFKNYQAAKGLQDAPSTSEIFEEFKFEEKRIEELHSKTIIALIDHDYCVAVSPTKELQVPESPLDTSIDHDYCTLKDGEKLEGGEAAAGSATAQTTTAPETPSKKKPKTPKKSKKRVGAGGGLGSSSSSDSSSDSDSSSCTCGSNCSCSSSSGSSSSSSSSSDSDSSSSEGRRRIAARRERRKQKALNRKKESEGSQAVDVVVTDPMAVNPFEALLLETDLDTDETETDEDFYDEHPQKLASKMLAEKRNQLMMGLVLSNGTEMETSRPPTPEHPPEPTPQELQPPQKVKKTKSKKRKKRNSSRSRNESQRHQIPPESMLSHHIPTGFYNNMRPEPMLSTPLSVVSQPQDLPSTPLQRLSIDQRSQTQGSGGSDAENKRCSKRKRVRNKFYGYSSDEDGEHPHPRVKPPAPPVLKWRKADLPSPSRHTTTAATEPPQQHQFVPSITIKTIPAPVVEPLRTTILRHSVVATPAASAAPDSESETQQRKSTDTSEDSDSDGGEGQLRINTQVRYPVAPPSHPPVAAPGGGGAHEQPGLMPGAGAGGRTDNLYCYCQCPYDEVSEMIACDGRDCTIEWFHFECVGIMVPPKGKWYCPECRKKNALRGELVHA